MRVWQVSKQTGEWPRFSEDDVLDFMVREAVLARGNQQEHEEQEKSEQRDWRREGLSEEAAAQATPRQV